MRLTILILFLTLTTTLLPPAAAAIDFVLEQEFTVPGSVRPITRFILGDIDNDLQPEVLLLVGSTTYLYSITGDSTIFQTIATGNQTVQAIALGDVTRDSIPDVIVSTFESPQANRGIHRVFVWSGASNYATMTEYVTDTLTFGQYFAISRHLLAPLDLDKDGYNELIFSYDSSDCLSVQTCLTEHLDRGTVIFRNFPNSISADPDFRLTAIDSLRTETGEWRYLATERRFDAYSGTGRDYIRSYLDLIDPWTEASPTTLLETSLPSASSAGTIDPCQMIAYFRTRATGDFLTGFDGDEFLIEYQWNYECAQEGAGGTTSGRELRLYRFDGASSLVRVWSQDIDGVGAGPYFVHPDWPGGFFMIREGEFVRVDGASGQSVDQADSFPPGVLYWLSPYGDGIPRMIALNGYNVSMYTVDITTAVGDDNPEVLPSSFTMGEPYPNPFNPSVSFSITLAQKTELTIAVFNALGQEVAQIYSGELPAGERAFVWDGTNQASGVYFIKATTTDGTQTKKAVLVK